MDGLRHSDTVQAQIAQAAAVMAVEEGLEWGAAKRRALRQLGLPPRTALPDNAMLEDAVREHLALFHAQTQPAELRALRDLARQWMIRLAALRPYLVGAVWQGTATRLSDIHLQLFCDDPKSAEIALIDQGLDYEVRSVTGFNGQPVDALSLRAWCGPIGETVGVHLMVFDHDDLRGALKPDTRGRLPRGDLLALEKLMEVSP